LKEDKTEKDRMDFKQLKIMALALSLPGAIAVASYLYEFVVVNKYLTEMTAIAILGFLLLSYIVLIIRKLYE